MNQASLNPLVFMQRHKVSLWGGCHIDVSGLLTVYSQAAGKPIYRPLSVLGPPFSPLHHFLLPLSLLLMGQCF